jgi:hypothetical protein
MPRELTVPDDPNRKRKGPPIEVELFEQAAAYLQTEWIPPEESELLSECRAALTGSDFDLALECLIQLGERQECSTSYWRVLERLAVGVWPTRWMVDRRAKGQRETRIESIRRRARPKRPDG